jgi:hypothetical protein
MDNENKENENVNTLGEFLAGERKAIEMVVEREDLGGWTLLHFINKDTGKEFHRQWVRKGRVFSDEIPKGEYTGGSEPYVMLFYRRIEKVFKGDYTGHRLIQLGALNVLSSFVQMNTGKLINKRTKQPLKQKDIAKALGVSVRTTAEILSNLKENGFLERKEGAYFIKRYFIAKGRGL